jgi:drug/metabolite transporter (DMT)-like permease
MNEHDSTLVSPAVAKRRLVGVTMLLAAAALWSLSGLAVKVLDVESPLMFTLWRSVGAAMAMGMLLPLTRGKWPPLRWIALAIVLHTGVVALLISAMTAATAARGILLQYTGPVFCAAFAWVLLGRRIDARTAVAMLLCAVGVGVMLAGADAPAGAWLDRGTVFGLLSGVLFGGLILTLETIDRKRPGVDPVKIVFVNNAGTALLLIPMVLASGAPMIPVTALAWVLLVGVVQLAMPYWLFQNGLRRVPAVEASLLIVLEPVLNPIWVWLAVGERPEQSTLVGGAFILLAMVIEALRTPHARAVSEA